MVRAPNRLLSNSILYTQGPTLNGNGFIITGEERIRILEDRKENAAVVFPYLNAKLYNSTVSLNTGCWAINFGNREFDEAAQFRAPFALVTERVKPARDMLTKQVHEARYWLYWDKRAEFFARVEGKTRLLITPITTKHLSFRFFPAFWVFSHALKLFDIQTYDGFAILQSGIHEAWARQYSSRLKEDLRYSTSDAFDTFCWPALRTKQMEAIGEAYYQNRESVMDCRSEGLTSIYNRFHNPMENSKDIVGLRAVHGELNQAVAAAYGWTDLDLGHGFHETKQGMRFTISEPARRTVLDRLLELNHQRYEEEVKAGLHDKKKKNSSRGKRISKSKNTSSDSQTLFVK